MQLTAPPKIPKKWLKLLREIPGYDSEATAEPGDKFVSKDAQAAIDFFEHCLTHVKGHLAGTKFLLEKWQKGILAAMFGWKRADGTRRYREVFLFVARKNGKTSFAAGLCLLVLWCDHEPGAEIYSAAAEREQASLVFAHAKGMVEAEPELFSALKVYGGLGQRAITLESENSSYKVISADAGTKHGGNVHLAVIDELHAQPNRDLVDVLMTGMGSRLQPITMHLTTSDFERESICNEKHEYASKVRDGILDDHAFLPIIYECTKDDDWTSPKAWKKANPNLGVSVFRDYLVRECKRAQDVPAFENTFKRLHLNIRTEQDERFIPMEIWDDAPIPDEASPDLLLGRKCILGVDLATTGDISAVVALFNLDPYWAVLPTFFVPEMSAHARENRDRVPYLTWKRQGHVTFTPGDTTDFEIIREHILNLRELYEVEEVAIDRWNSTQLQNQLVQDGFEVVPYAQTFGALSSPTARLLEVIKSRKMVHYSHPVMRWMASNVTVLQDAAGNVRPFKEKGPKKIDGIVALIMALGRALVFNPTPPSVYEDRGLVRLGGNDNNEQAEE